MLTLILVVIQARAHTMTKIPITHAPPPAMISSSAIYDSKTNSLFSIGGDQVLNDKQIEGIFSFNLDTQLWKVISYESEYSPPFIVLHMSYLRKDRKILNFGRYTELLIYDLEIDEWSRAASNGNRMKSITAFGGTGFMHNETEYFAIYGGINENGYIGELYLIDVYTFEFRKMPANGTVPYPRIYPSVEYFNGSLYIFGYSHVGTFVGEENGEELYRYDLDAEFWEVVEVFGSAPSQRLGHYSAIYKNEMYITFGFIQEQFKFYLDCYKFNFESRTWYYLTTFSTGFRALAAKVQVDNIIYIMFGRDLASVYNTVFAIDLETDVPKLSVVSGNWLSPPSRVNHCSFVVNQKMYIFGGSNGKYYDLEIFYNDMWAYDFEKKEWSSISPFGDIPGPRKFFGCSKTTGDVAAIFGGIDESGYLNDLYYFHEPQLYWYKVTSSNNPPSVRSQNCLAYHNNLLYIIGGLNDKAAFNEIWIYDFATNMYSLSTSTVAAGDFETIVNAKCWIDTYTDKTKLIVIGGEDQSSVPNDHMFEFELLENNELNLTVKELGSIYDFSIIGIETSVVVTEDYIIRIGGFIYSYILLQQYMVYDRKTGEFTIVDISQEFGAWGHSAIHYQDTIYIFGGAGEPGAVSLYISNDVTNYFFELDLKPNFTIGCSKGTEGEGCKPCPKGTYFNKNKCEKCPAGRYNDLLAADSLEQCSPCSESTFNDKKGASYCLECAFSEICPIGTTSPFKASELPSNSSVQPSSYVSKKDFISSIVNNLWYAFGGISLITCILCFFLHQIYKKLKAIDFFVDKHEIKLEQPIQYKKTSLGGVFSLMFVLASGITFISGLLNFNFNNFTELRALVPVIILEKEIVSKFVAVDVKFYIYGGDCVKEDECNPLIEYLNEGFSYVKRKITCKQVSSNCQVHVEYQNLKLSSKNSAIYIKMKEKFSYASGLSVNITSTSSIPNHLSSIMTSIQPSSTQTLFRGKSPSVFHYKFTPSIFTSESSEWPAEDTGFHISTDQVAASGSVAPRETLNLELYMLVNIFIVESDTAMITQRIQNQTWFAFGGSLLGSIFGLLGTFGWILSTTEGITIKIASRIEKKKIFKEQSMMSRKLRGEFRAYSPGHSKAKVTPFETSITVMTSELK